MVRFALLLILPVLLVQGCAEIVPLTGGPEDDYAPRVVSQEPEQGSTNFHGNEIVLEFDEYAKLNDPLNTISVNPADMKITSELKNKTLRLSWNEPLRENTTYIIQLNGTVRDNNESNDSIMQLVFSTGPVIDSLSYSGRVAGAFSNAAMNQITLGLYAPDSNPLQAKPVYATRSDSKGQYAFNYLKPGSYRLFAFQDANKDQKVQPGESIGFLPEMVTAGDTKEQVIRLFAPKAVHSDVRFTYIAPGMMVVHNKDSFDLSRLSVNGQPAELLQQYAPDSIAVTLPIGTGSNYQFTYDTVTITKPVTQAERTISLAILQEGKVGKWQPGDSLFFRVNDRITAVDTSKINLTTEKGAPVDYRFERPRPNSFVLIPNPKTTDHLNVRFERQAVSGQTSHNDTLQFVYTTLLPADLSTLHLQCEGFEGQWVIELTLNDKAMYTLVKPAGETAVTFTKIEPGQYNVRCIADRNGNGIWDTGNFATGELPETIERYTLTQKLRPNWEVEETLKREP